MCKMGVTGLHDSHARVLAVLITLLSRVYLLERALRLILQENSFQFNGKNYLQTHGTAMGTKMAVAFANIFMAKVETDILSQSVIKPLKQKRCS